MKRAALFILFTALLATQLSAQKEKKLSKVLTLQMPDGNGTNGASVTWNPQKRLYYAAFAGNIEYPLAVFSNNGTRLSNDDLVTGFDMRGMWYNPETKKLYGNGFADYGWIAYDMGDDGIPTTPSVVFEGSNQPDDQSVGVFDEDYQMICFLHNAEIVQYKAGEGTEEARFTLKPDTKSDESESDGEILSADYNYTSMIYTGVKGAEYGLYNFTTKTVELYNKKKGTITEKWQLPDDAPAPNAFNFAFANGIVWLFDIENRQWIGYK